MFETDIFIDYIGIPVVNVTYSAIIFPVITVCSLLNMIL